MSDARVTAITLSMIITVAFWVTVTITTFYAAAHAAYYPHTQNPYYAIATVGLVPTVVSTFITIMVWMEGLEEARNGRR